MCPASMVSALLPQTRRLGVANEDSWTAELLDLEAGRIGFPVLDREGIRALLASKPRIAIVGASPNPMRPSHGVLVDLQSLGYDVVPVNPTAEEVAGLRCYPSLREAVECDGPGRHRGRVPPPTGVPRARPRGRRRRRSLPVAPARDRQPRGWPDRPRGGTRDRDEPVPRRRGGAPVIAEAALVVRWRRGWG